jgi:N-acetylglucosamine kinase-like BadF-type ATPase
MNVPVDTGVTHKVVFLEQNWALDRDVDYLVFVGVDGGGTATNCLVWVVDAEKHAAGAFDLDTGIGVAATARCMTGAANANSAGMDKAVANVTTAIGLAVEKVFESFNEDVDTKYRPQAAAAGLFQLGQVNLPYGPDETAASGRKRKNAPPQRTARFRLAGVTLGLAGCDSAASAELWRDRLLLDEAGILSDTLVVDSDAVIALARATKGKARGGAVIIAGTGTVAFAVSHDGKSKARTQGFGPAFNDVGSGHWLGSKVLECTARALDGRLPHNIFEGIANGNMFEGITNGYLNDAEKIVARTALKHIGITTSVTTTEGDAVDMFEYQCVKARENCREDIIKWAYKDGPSPAWDKVASLAPILFARWGKERTRFYVDRILNEAARGLASALYNAIERVTRKGTNEFTVALVGGTLTYDVYRAKVIEHVKTLFEGGVNSVTFYDDPCSGKGVDVGGPSAGAVEMSVRSFEAYVAQNPGQNVFRDLA